MIFKINKKLLLNNDFELNNEEKIIVLLGKHIKLI